MSAAKKKTKKKTAKKKATKAAPAPAEPRGSTDYAKRPAPMDADFPGTPLSGRDFYGGKVATWDDQYTVEYDWDSGVAICPRMICATSPGSTLVPAKKRSGGSTKSTVLMAGCKMVSGTSTWRKSAPAALSGLLRAAALTSTA